MTVPLIGLYSPAPGSGKTELANVLVHQHSYVSVKFAACLKDMLRFILTGALGISLEETFRYTDGDLKEAPIPFFGMKTCRHMMQTLGTDWGRTLISPTIWIDIWKARVARLLKDGWRVVVDDMRFPNEHDAVLALGGATVLVTRPGLVETTGHASEGLLDKFPFEYVLGNDGSLEKWQEGASLLHAKLSQARSVA